VTRAVLRLVVSALPATLGLVIALVFLPGRRELVFDVYMLVLGGLALLELVRATRAALPAPAPSPFERALRRRPAEAERPGELARLEREVTLGVASAFDLHARLLPVLRQVADERLRERRGVDLETQPHTAREALGPEAWDLLRPDRERPTDRDEPGLPVARLEAIVATLERL
jgi:hypothetical protein